MGRETSRCRNALTAAAHRCVYVCVRVYMRVWKANSSSRSRINLKNRTSPSSAYIWLLFTERRHTFSLSRCFFFFPFKSQPASMCVRSFFSEKWPFAFERCPKLICLLSRVVTNFFFASSYLSNEKENCYNMLYVCICYISAFIWW